MTRRPPRVVTGAASLLVAEAPGSSTSDDTPYTGDSVSLTGTATGTYNSKDVATATSVAFGGISLTGAQASDYTLGMQTPASATITAKTISESGLSVPVSMVYNDTTTAVVIGSAALLAAEASGTGSTADDKPYTGDTVGLTGIATGTYNFKDVATASSVTFAGLSLTGAQAGDYSLAMQTPTSATITPKTISESGLSVAASKTYDATTSATIIGAASLLTAEAPGSSTGDDKPYTGDTVSITGTPTGTYNSKDVATASSVTFAGLSLTGAQSGDYALSMQAPQATMIVKAPLTVMADDKTKVAGTIDSILTATITGFVNGEVFDTSGVTGSASISRVAGDTASDSPYLITPAIGSLSASNYYFGSFVTGLFTITPPPVDKQLINTLSQAVNGLTISYNIAPPVDQSVASSASGNSGSDGTGMMSASGETSNGVSSPASSPDMTCFDPSSASAQNASPLLVICHP